MWIIKAQLRFIILFGLMTVVAPRLELDASERAEPNPDYIALDRAMFARVTPGLLENPPRLDVLTPRHLSFEDQELGFGYRLEGRAAGGGYLSLFGWVLWKGNVPESLYVSTALPRAPVLAESYQQLFRPLFGVSAGTKAALAQRFWGWAQAVEPLPADLFRLTLPSPAELANHPDFALLEWLMTPFSGTSYDSPYSRRAAWSRFTRLDTLACSFLLRSKNPVTRLIAIETLRRHGAEWGVDLHSLAEDFETIYRSVPRVETRQGDVMRVESARALVERFVAVKTPTD